MIDRTLKAKLIDLLSKYPIVTLTGPRQSGKSTLLRHALPDYKYVSLEDPDMRMMAEGDPRGFLLTYPDKTIIDEAQRVPTLFSYLQTHTDVAGKEGMYVLAGSHNFLLMQSVNQSLAGRAAILKLLPFSNSELRAGGILPSDLNTLIFNGSYPRLYDKNIPPTDYYPFYIQTYVERDVRQIRNITDLGRFIKFIKLCAGRVGQLFNASSLSNELGVSVSTIADWVSVLQASYICYMLRPDFNNFAKRVVKTPKLYFYDTGLACSLLEIRSASQLETHYLRGGLFENMVINEFVKKSLHSGIEPNLSFWRDSSGTEVDLLSYDADTTSAYEIKSSATFSDDYFRNITKWSKLSSAPTSHCHVVYAGSSPLLTSFGSVIPWSKI